MLHSSLGITALFTLLSATQPVEPAEPAPAPAEPAPAEPAPARDFGSDQDAVPTEKSGKKKKKKKDKADSDGQPADMRADKTELDADQSDFKSQISERLEWKGRVFFLGEYRDEVLDAGAGEIAVDGLTLSVPSARAGFKAKIRDKVTLTLEADFAGGRVSIRDGFIQAKNKHFLLRAGRFKMPISAFTLESPWKLPRAQRGVLDDILSEQMLLSGRREGLMGRWEGGGFWDFAVTAGVFQSLDVFSPKHLTSVLRLSIEPKNTEIAAVGMRRSALVSGVERAFNQAGAELTSVERVGAFGLRTWAEAYVGQSWFHQPAAGVDIEALRRGPAATFIEGRVMAAVRLGGVERDEKYAELFLSGGLLDPDVDVRQDLFFEVSAGINLGHWDTTRLTFELVHAQSGRNFPDTIFRDAVLATVVRRTAGLLQLGAAF
jgi:hypothetical protein